MRSLTAIVKIPNNGLAPVSRRTLTALVIISMWHIYDINMVRLTESLAFIRRSGFCCSAGYPRVRGHNEASEPDNHIESESYEVDARKIRVQNIGRRRVSFSTCRGIGSVATLRT